MRLRQTVGDCSFDAEGSPEFVARINNHWQLAIFEHRIAVIEQREKALRDELKTLRHNKHALFAACFDRRAAVMGLPESADPGHPEGGSPS